MRLERGRKKRISQINDVVDFYVNENDEQWHEKKHSFREGRRNRERRPKKQAQKRRIKYSLVQFRTPNWEYSIERDYQR